MKTLKAKVVETNQMLIGRGCCLRTKEVISVVDLLTALMKKIENNDIEAAQRCKQCQDSM